MIKIFSAGKLIYLISKQTLFQPKKNAILANIGSEAKMHRTYSELIANNSLHEIYFHHENEKLLFQFFSSMFKIVEAAGGLVKNANGEYLFIFRHNKWDLPKGKIEKGEKVKKAAIREVEEECGIKGLKITKELTPTYHTYFIEKTAILKPVYWFEMSCDDKSDPVPQKEEGITDVRWLGKNELKQVRENTFPSILEVIKEIGEGGS